MKHRESPAGPMPAVVWVLAGALLCVGCTAPDDRGADAAAMDEVAVARARAAEARLTAARDALQRGHPEHATEHIERAVAMGADPEQVAALRAQVVASRPVDAAVPDASPEALAAREKAEAKDRVTARREQVQRWIDEANAVAGDKETCDTANEVLAVWQNLQDITRDDRGFGKARQAAARLEKCRQKMKRTLTEAIRGVMKGQREAWAEKVQREMRAKGARVTVRLRGKYADRARLEWVMVSEALVDQLLADPDYTGNLEKIGFKQIVFADGFRMEYTVKLDPQDESNGGQHTLEKMGLGQPLRLTGR